MVNHQKNGTGKPSPKFLRKRILTGIVAFAVLISMVGSDVCLAFAAGTTETQTAAEEAQENTASEAVASTGEDQIAATGVVITGQPQDVTAELGETVSFTVTATGSGLSYQWQFSSNSGSTWTNSANKTKTCTATATAARNGYLYRCIITDSSGNTATTRSAKLTVNVLAIITQPQDVTADVGDSVSFTVEATGSGLSYQWQYSRDGGTTWANSANKTATNTTTATTARNGYLYRCIVTDSNGDTVTSDTAKLTLNILAIITQPADVTAEVGDTVSFTVEATGSGLSYQWQYSTNSGTTWTNSAYKSATCKATATAARNGYLYRCVITDSDGDTVTSNAAKLTVNILAIITQPQDVTADVGDSVSFTVEATGSGLTYQWQYSRDSGATWTNSANKTAINTTTATAARNGYLYRCIVTDSNGDTVTSNTAKLTLNILAIISQPENVTTEAGASVSFTVEATGSGLSYQWQYSTDGGTNWANSAYKSATCKVTATKARNGYLYRCIVTDSNGDSVTSDTAELTVYGVYITGQPEDVTADVGESVGFTVTATGDGLSYQWQYSMDGGLSWNNSAYKSDTCKVTATKARNGYLYRCVITDSDGDSVTSDVATLTVNVLTITAQPEDVTATVGESVSFTVEATGSGLTYQWQFSSNSGISWSNSAYKTATCKVTATAARNGYLYRCVVTDASGDTATSDVAKLTVTTLEIVTQPADWTGAEGTMSYFYVKATGDGLSYLWQISTNNGKSWADSSNTTNLYSVTITEARAGRMFRCAITDANGATIYSDSAKLSISDSFEIVKQPSSYSGALDETVYFFLQAGGTGLTYQWQTSLTGTGDWTDLTTATTVTATTPKLSQTISPYTAGYYYRCIVTDADGSSLTSDVVRLTYEGSGFISWSDKVFYVKSDGSVATGLTTIDGNTYYFSATGAMQTGYAILDGVRYYFDETTGAAITGFLTMENGNTYYFNGGEGAYTGLHEIDGKLYYFDPDYAIMYTGFLILEGQRYYFGEDGAAANGWYYRSTSHATYYITEDGTAYTGWLTLDGKTYHFSSSGIMSLGITKIGGEHYYFDLESGVQKTGLIEVGINNYMYFSEEDGTAQNGLMEINGALYYFSTEEESLGVALSGLQTIDGDTYYFDTTTKTAVSGWIAVDERTYYMGSDYTMQTGIQNIDGKLYLINDSGNLTSGLKTINGSIYYFDSEDGAAISGWYTSVNGNTYYFDPDSYTAVTGLQKIDGAYYYFNSSGIIRTGRWEIDGAYYLFDSETGESLAGMQEYVINGVTYKSYFDEDTYQALTGVQEIDGAWYYFGDTGLMRTGIQTVNGVTCYFDLETGAAMGGFIKQSNGNTYYYDGINGPVSGLQEFDGSLYYLGSSGYVQYGRFSIDGAYYMFDANTGEALTGWQIFLNSSGKAYWMYFDETTYQAYTGLHTIDGVQYYFDGDYGYLQVSGSTTIDGVRYYCDTVTGALATTRATYSWDSTGTYYTSSTGETVTGLQVISNVLYYFDETGALTTGWVTVNGNTYYFDPDTGTVATGEQTIDGDSYYFSTVDASMWTGWHRLNSRAYFYDEDGKQMSSGWIELYSGKMSYFDADNGILTGLQEIDGNTYYFNAMGIMLYGIRSVTVSDGNSATYYFDENGIKSTGLIELNGSYYYFDEETAELQTGWQTIDGNTYYFSESSGKAQTGLRTINDYNYYFDENGIRQLGMITISGKLYYLSADTDDGFCYGLTEIDGKTYYFNDYGQARTGYQIIDDVKYYFDPDTGASVGGVYWIYGTRAYGFVEGGGILTGLQVIDGNTYYFYPNGGKMAAGLVSIDDTLYYFDAEKGMLTDTTVEVAGITYVIDSTGAVTASGDSKIATLINSAIEKLGIPYGSENIDNEYYVGDSSETGSYYSCSLLVSTVLADAGIDVTSGGYLQYFALTSGDYDVELVSDLSEAQPGDIVYLCRVDCLNEDDCDFWNEIHHVMIYLGDGKVLESTPSEDDPTRNGVNIWDYSEDEENFIFAIVRISGLYE